MVMKKTIVSRLAIVLFSLIFVSTNTEGYPTSFTSHLETKSYNPFSLFDFNNFHGSISEPNEEEARLDSFHQSQIHSSLSFYIPLPIEYFSESLTKLSVSPVSTDSLEKPKNRAPPTYYSI